MAASDENLLTCLIMSDNPSADVQFVNIGQLSVADFEPLLNAEFVADLNYCGIDLDGAPRRRDDAYPPDAKLVLTLVEVNRRKPVTPHVRQEPFTLLFRGSHELPLHSESHVLIHESMGHLSLFLSPVNAYPGILPERHPEGRFYEAVVN